MKQTIAPTQDVIADLVRTSGPFPINELEQAAINIFALSYAQSDWDEPRMSIERNACRKLALQIRIDFLKMDRWSIEDANEQLADEMQDLIFGTERRIGKTLRGEIMDYCETFLADAWGHFSKRLFYPKDIEANQAEVENEVPVDGRD